MTSVNKFKFKLLGVQRCIDTDLYIIGRYICVYIYVCVCVCVCVCVFVCLFVCLIYSSKTIYRIYRTRGQKYAKPKQVINIIISILIPDIQ